MRERTNATHETPIEQALRTRISEIEGKQAHRLKPVTSLELTRLYGLGENPRLRLALYAKIEQAYQAAPEPVARIVWNAVRRSKLKERAERWFCAVAIDDLQRAGLIVHDDL